MSRSYYHRPSFWARAGQVLLVLVCSAGALAGGFLILCFLGVLSPAAISQQVSAWLEPEPPATTTIAPSQKITVPSAPPPFHGIFLSLDQLDSAEQLAQGTDGIILPMKDPDGTLGYVSALSLAADARASAADPQRNQALQDLNDTPGLHTVAQVSCLRDGALVKENPALALRRVSGSPWLDETGQGWLDPTVPETQSYLAGVCQELAQLGFDEILLTHCAFPTQGALDTLRPTGSKTAALETFCRQLQGALADYEVTLSVQGQPDSAQPNSASGQTTALLATFGRVWVQEEDQAALAAFHPSVLPAEP